MDYLPEFVPCGARWCLSLLGCPWYTAHPLTPPARQRLPASGALEFGSPRNVVHRRKTTTPTLLFFLLCTRIHTLSPPHLRCASHSGRVAGSPGSSGPLRSLRRAHPSPCPTPVLAPPPGWHRTKRPQQQQGLLTWRRSGGSYEELHDGDGFSGAEKWRLSLLTSVFTLRVRHVHCTRTGAVCARGGGSGTWDISGGCSVFLLFIFIFHIFIDRRNREKPVWILSSRLMQKLILHCTHSFIRISYY